MRLLLITALTGVLAAGCAAGGAAWPADGGTQKDARPDRKKIVKKDKAVSRDTRRLPDRAVVRKDGPVTPDTRRWPDLRPRPDLRPKPDQKPTIGPCRDLYESNENCSVSHMLGSVQEDAGWLSKKATLDPMGDVDWYTGKGLEKSHLCVPGSKQPYIFSAKLDVPAGRQMRICLHQKTCSAKAACLDNKGLPGPTTLTLKYTVNGLCTINDDTEAKIMIQAVDGKHACVPYAVAFQYQ